MERMQLKDLYWFCGVNHIGEIEVIPFKFTSDGVQMLLTGQKIQIQANIDFEQQDLVAKVLYERYELANYKVVSGTRMYLQINNPNWMSDPKISGKYFFSMEKSEIDFGGMLKLKTKAERTLNRQNRRKIKNKDGNFNF